METKIFQQYAEVKAKIAELSNLEDILKAAIKDELEKNNLQKIENPFGKFTLYPTTRWVYTPAVKKLSEKVKLAQIKEQETGKAKAEITQSLRYTNNE